MKTIQKPKRMWQKKKDYNKKKLIRKIQRRNKTSFDGGKDESYSDLKTNRPIIIGPGLLSMFTPKPKGYKEGKDCFDTGTDRGQQMIYQDGDQYFAGPSESAATIKVTPYIQRLPNDKSTWDFVDDSGKLYTTKYSDEQLKYLYGQNTPGSEFYTWTDRSGKQHRQMKIIPVSPVDPVGEMAVETALGYPLFKGVGWAGKQLVNDFVKDFAFTKLGNWTKNKILSSALNKNVKAWDGTIGPEYFNSPSLFNNKLTYYPTIEERVNAFVNKLPKIENDYKFNPKWADDYQELQIYNMLMKYGIPPEKITSGTIKSILDLSEQKLKENMPKGANIISSNGDDIKITDWQNGQEAGWMDISKYPGTDELLIGMVNKNKNFNGIGKTNVYEHTLQAAIQNAHKKGYDGVLSGHRLLMPDVTKHLWGKPYIKSIHFGDTGVHGEIPNEKTGQEIRKILDMPYNYPTRSVEFDPNYTIDEYGNFWRSWEGSDIFHNSGKDIHIKKANRGKFTEAANEHNMGVQEFARQVLSAPKGKYSSTLRKRANFARNFAH